MSLLLANSVLLATVSILLPGCLGVEECIKGPSYLYTGNRSTTKSGLNCQRWDSREPHEILPKNIPKDGGHHNNCRNPDKDSRGTWCYTTDPSVRWEYCKIPKCNDSALLLWTSFVESKNSSIIDYTFADPEVMIQNDLIPDANGLYGKLFENAQIHALDVSKDGKEIFFIDKITNYFGVINTETLSVEKFLEGKAKHIYAIIQDWRTKNFYWTDTSTMSVMVADRNFKTNITIFTSATTKPRALAILPDMRGIVFSTYVKLDTKIPGAKIVITNMKGKKKKVILQSPDVMDATGLAVDNERIYWTDNLGYACTISSCKFDGTDKIEHYFKKASSFQDIAVYSDYIYVTDAQKRYNYFDQIRYHVEIIGKNPEEDQVFTYTKQKLPHGIAILEKKNESSVQLCTDISLVRCQRKCDGVCLANRSGFYRCMCPRGFRVRVLTGACLPARRKIAGNKTTTKRKSNASN